MSMSSTYLKYAIICCFGRLVYTCAHSICCNYCKTFITILFSYGKGLLAARPTPKLEDHPLLSAAAYSMYSQPPSIIGGPPSICSLRIRHTVVTRDSPNPKKVIKLIVIIIVGYHCYQLQTKCYRISSSQG
jgi:hypothetical protein